MSPRVAIWTSAFDEDMEAISSEVALLLRTFPRSIRWGLSHRHRLLLRRRTVAFHPRLHLVFRAMARLLEPLADINHVFGSVGDWFYLQGHRQRPTIVTAATDARPVDDHLLSRIDRFVVEHPAGRDTLRGFGIDASRIRLIFPPVDLRKYVPSDKPAGPFTVLFASSPERTDWLDARGLPALLDAAELRPHMQFRLLWRPWGDSLSSIQAEVARRELGNVQVVPGRVADMSAEYRRCHTAVAPFMDMTRSKPVPNSLVESLASGRPVVCTAPVGLAQIVEESGAGAVCGSTGESLADALDHVAANWFQQSRNARRAAETCFDQDVFTSSYAQLYQELLPAHSRTSSRRAPGDMTTLTSGGA